MGIALSWSGGKDAALALHELRAARRPVRALVTTVTGDYDRISIHGVRRTLLEAQARAVGVPLTIVEIPAAPTNEVYTRAMLEALGRLRAGGVRTLAFGDILLPDVRAFREELAHTAGLHAIFPIWGGDTRRIARRIIDLEFRATLTCVDTEALDASFAGRTFDQRLVDALPPGVDPCGEKGEFHTFVTDGPIFRWALSARSGETVLRDGRFAYHDLLPVRM